MQQRCIRRWPQVALGALCALAALGLVIGCGGGASGPAAKLVPVSGKVTYKGQPLAKGRVSLMPVKPGNTSTGDIVDGAFKLSTYQKDDGAPPGSYKVAVTAWEKEPTMESPKGVPAIPQKYFDAAKSGLTAEVGVQKTELTFDLKE